MNEHLIVVDMQNDFIDGALGTPEAVAIVPKVLEKISQFPGQLIFTRDTHGQDYLQTQEGRHLPVPHCIRDSDGWQIRKELASAAQGAVVINKPSFGSPHLAELLVREHNAVHIDRITLVGLCTDICVISNAMLIKAALPEVPIVVDASCCAGVTPESHRNALAAMKMCQIQIDNES